MFEPQWDHQTSHVLSAPSLYNLLATRALVASRGTPLAMYPCQLPSLFSRHCSNKQRAVVRRVALGNM